MNDYLLQTGKAPRLLGPHSTTARHFGPGLIHTADTAPSQEVADAILALVAAKKAKATQLYSEGRTATLAIFSALPIGVQAQFSPVLDASDKAAKSGDIATAKQIIETCVVPPELAGAQTALAAALDSIITRAVALAAATTLEAIAAI